MSMHPVVTWLLDQPHNFVFPDFRMADRQDPGLPYMWDSGMDGGPPGGTSSDVPQMDASSGIPTSFPYGSNRLKSPHLNRPMSVPPPSAHMYNPQVPRSLDNPIPAHGGPMGISTSAPTASSTSSPLVVPHPVKMTRTNKTYHCRMCDQIFDSKSDLLVHSQHVHKQDPKPYKCPTCNKCFANSSYLSQHNRIHAGIKPYKCQICERKFTQLCHLQQHMRTHTGEKPYKCQHPGCGKAFTQLSNLQSHSRSHMTDKPYRCNSCYKCYTDEQGLREHIPKHSETKHLKTHICHICGKSYTQETYLTRHMQKHSFDQSGRNQMTNAQSKLVQGIGQPDITELKSPQLDGLVTSPTDSPRQSGSAFMPLGHQYPGHNMINSSVPSNFPFPPPRIPQSTLSSPLPHISSVSTSRPYFPFDPVSFPKREPMERSIARDGNMIANSLLSLQQIKTFSQSHGVSSSHASAVFPKSEPSSPVHKDF